MSRIVMETLPKERGQVERKMFELVRRLKAIPECRDNVEQLRPVVEEWHARAGEFIDRDVKAMWGLFQGTWMRVLCPDLGTNPLDLAHELAQREPLPTEAKRYRSYGMRRLVALCYQIQQLTEPEPFFLSCRDAGRMLGTDRMTAARWLRKLAADDVLLVVDRGGPRTNKATRYRYRNPRIQRF